MKKIIIDKNMLIQLKHEIKLDELNAIYTLLKCGFCIEVFNEINDNRLSEFTFYKMNELEEYLSNNSKIVK